jgi:hypothetical protein
MRHLLCIMAIAMALFSCQKEVNQQVPPSTNPTGPAVFSFGGAPNACSLATIAGYYASGTVLSETNTATVQVNVTTVGAYTISTNSANGYKFAATGTFTTTGVQNIKLTGSGTPLTAQTDEFIPSMGGISGCKFTVTTIVPAPAVFTLVGSPTACTDVTISGTYGLGTPLTSTNTITVKVNVTSKGSFTIATNTVGGMTFSKSGGFDNTGVQTVVLAGSGTPTTAGVNAFTVGTGGCTFNVNVVGPAVFTYLDGTGVCSVPTVGGTYGVGTPLVAANTVTVKANVTNPGTFTISTTSGGMTFSKTGEFTTTGIQNVVLQGTGTPTTGGPNVFNIGSCTFSIPVVGPAVFTFLDGSGACTAATPAGTYSKGTALNGTNTVTIMANVTTIGAYNISTTQNGMTFKSTANFTNTGIQPVVLQGSGTPTTGGINKFTLPGSACTFDINVIIPAVAPGIYQCKIDGVLYQFLYTAHAETLDDFFNPPVPRLFLDGMIGPPTGNHLPYLHIFIDKNDQSVVGPGTYDEKHYAVVNGYRITIAYLEIHPDFSSTLWTTGSNSLFGPNPPFTITVTSVTGGRVKGTFSGKTTNMAEGSTGTKVITEGVFDLPIEN